MGSVGGSEVDIVSRGPWFIYLLDIFGKTNKVIKMLKIT